MRPEIARAIELLAANDPGKADEALGLLQSTVFSFSMKVCGHREDAEDTMQEVLFKSIPHLSRIQDPRALAVWLYTVTQNQCRMAHRKSRFAPTRVLPLDELLPGDQELAMLLADSSAGPEAAAIGRQQDEMIHRSVLELSPKYRLILVLHDMEDLDTTDIAKIMSLKEGTVRVRLHRARLLVRREIAQHRSPAAAKKRPAQPSPKRRSHDCRRMFANLSEYLDHRIDTLTCDRIQRHMEACPPCVAFIRDLESVIERCRKFDPGCSLTATHALNQLLTQRYLAMISGKENDRLESSFKFL